jgi:hypothetical protein
LLTEEFFKKWPVTKYHGTHIQDGTVIAKLSNPLVDEGKFGGTEVGLHESIEQARTHQKRCPWDNRNLQEIAVYEKALAEVQAEKSRLGMPLDSPPIKGPFVLTVIPGGREPA